MDKSRTGKYKLFFSIKLPIDGCGEGVQNAADDDSETAVTPGDKKLELSGDNTNKIDCCQEKLANNVDAGENAANESALSNNVNNKQQNNNHGRY